jgi:hypothetical protein
MSPAYSPHPVHCHRPRSWAIAILLAASSLSCGDDDPVTPPLATPSAIVKIAGDEQAGRVSQVVPEPLVVQVLDQAGNPVAGVSVTWVAQGGGSVSPETVPTDSDGLASADRVLGPTAGDQSTTAAVSELPGIPPVTFTTRALAEE